MATEEKHIILPGDPLWDKPRADEVATASVPKLPNELLEAAFTEVVGEVKEAIEAKPEEVPASVTPAAAPPGPQPSYKYHQPARQRFIDVPVPRPIEAVLLENLPKAWERKCYVGGFDYVAVEGQTYKKHIRRPGFRKGDSITLTGMTFVPGSGAMYAFKEGSRGGFCVRPDQVSFSLPAVVETAQSSQNTTPTQDHAHSIVGGPDAPMDGQNAEVQ